MGLIISKFRKQKSTIEVLEEIDKNIATHQRFKRQNQEYQKKFIASLILYSIIAYVVVVVVFFICYFPQSWKDWLFASIPLLLFPVLIWLVKKLMHWYFVKRISSNELALQELRDKKKDILEDVMETETYKKAKEILEKFDPARFKELEIKPLEKKPATEVEPLPEVVRQRIITTRTMSPVMRMPNPVQPMSAPHPHQRNLNPSIGSPMQMVSQMNGRQMPMVHPGYGRSPGPPMPRPVPPRERKTLDKFIDYLVGEGPQNRYALICRYCHSHNGMAMREEFEYISFRCCYCYHLNPAKKQRPHAPRLDFPTPQSSPARKAIAAPDSKSSEEKGSSEEEDDASTSSKKSEDEILETEKTDNEVSDEAGAEAPKSATEPVESVEESDDIPMADEDGTEENADEGEQQVEDGMGTEIVKDELAGTQDVVEASLAAVNEPQTGATTESQEHKTKKEEDVISDFVTMEHVPLTSAEKPDEAEAREAKLSAEILKITQEALPIAEEISMPEETNVKQLAEDILTTTESLTKELTEEVPVVEKTPPTTEAEEVSVTTETDTQPITKDVLMPAEISVAEETPPTTEAQVFPKDTEAEEVSVMTETNTQQTAKDVLMPAEISVAEETSPTTEAQVFPKDTEAEEVSVTTETNSQQTAKDVLMPTDTVAKEISMTVDQAIKEALTTAETATEVAPISMNTTVVEASMLVGTPAVEDLITIEAAATEEVSMTADNAVNEDLEIAEIVSKQISQQVPEQAPVVEEIPQFMEPDTLHMADEVLRTADTATGEVLMSAETDVQQIAIETKKVPETADTVAPEIIQEFLSESPKCIVEDPELSKSTVLVEEPQVMADGEFVEKENIEEMVELDEYEMVTEVVEDEAVIPPSIAEENTPSASNKEEVGVGAVKESVDSTSKPTGDEKPEKLEISHLTTTQDSEPLMK